MNNSESYLGSLQGEARWGFFARFSCDACSNSTWLVTRLDSRFISIWWSVIVVLSSGILLSLDIAHITASIVHIPFIVSTVAWWLFTYHHLHHMYHVHFITDPKVHNMQSFVGITFHIKFVLIILQILWQPVYSFNNTLLLTSAENASTMECTVTDNWPKYVHYAKTVTPKLLLRSSS